METLDKQALGVFALEFLDDLEKCDARDGVERDYYHAVFMVADLDDDGDVRIAMRTSGSNGMTNIRVLQAAQLLETKTLVRNLTEGYGD